MIECGDTSLLRFTKLKGMNHSQLARFFYVDETYQWFLSHSRSDSIRSINKDIEITTTALNSAYQSSNREQTKITIADSQKGNVETTTEKNSSTAKFHTIKKGDTLSAIARKYHTSVQKLCKLNKIKETTILSLGRKLRVR